MKTKHFVQHLEETILPQEKRNNDTIYLYRRKGWLNSGWYAYGPSAMLLARAFQTSKVRVMRFRRRKVCCLYTRLAGNLMTRHNFRGDYTILEQDIDKMVIRCNPGLR